MKAEKFNFQWFEKEDRRNIFRASVIPTPLEPQDFRGFFIPFYKAFSLIVPLRAVKREPTAPTAPSDPRCPDAFCR